MRALAAAARGLAVGLACAWAAAAGAQPRVLDDFRQPGAWKASASDQVRATARADARGGLCLDYDFAGVSGYAVLRRELPMEFPANYAFELRLRGTGPANDFQFKLVDASGDNVWWHARPAYAFPAAAERLRIRQRQVTFAWGPATDRTLRKAAALELVVVAGREGGGKGSACFERLAFEALPPPGEAPAIVATASGTRAGFPAAHAVDGEAGTAWRSAAAGSQWLRLDLGARREFDGLSLRWREGERAADYDVEASDDGRAWRTIRQVRDGAGPDDALFLPESEARHLRLRLRRAAGPRYGLADIALHEAGRWPDMNAVMRWRAAHAPRGRFPRGFLGEQSYWTLVGVDGGGARSSLFSEEGAVEALPGGFSVEPFVRLADGTLVTWADVRLETRLRDGYLPLPAVRWTHPRFTLDIEVAAQGTRAQSRTLARFALRPAGTEAQPVTLLLAVRPMQVNPPQQFLAVQGGASPIRRLQWRDGTLRVNGRAALLATRPPDAVAASPWDGGDVLEKLPAVRATRAFDVTDPAGFATAALAWTFAPAPGAPQAVTVALPLAGEPQVVAGTDDAWAHAQFDRVAEGWRGRLDRVTLRLPGEGAALNDTLRSSLAHILMSRDGPALQPGTRSYARSWVRDGAMMVAALLRLGEVDAAVEFVDWFAGYLFDNGKVPCCVDRRGADPVVENDSHGQYLYAVAEVWRHTRDPAWLGRHWAKVARVAEYLETLRQSERIPANREGGRAAWWGLMPASISHEGYSDKPMHSYWDDFWALRGLRDAVVIAKALGHEAEVARFAPRRDEFERELVASIRTAVARHGIAYIPGAAELGDFDATSTTVALDPAQAEGALPAGLLEATFERYWQESTTRTEGRRKWKDYTPYELRTVGALVRLGRHDRALAMLRFFFRDQRPAGWNQWAEVVLPDAREARFLGDMPHAWVSSDFIRSALDFVAWPREADQAVVIGAGIPDEWLAGEGVAVDRLPTPWGRVAWQARREGATVVVTVPAMASPPPGGIVLRLPALVRAGQARVNGQAAAATGGELRLTALPARIEIEAQR